MVAKVSFRSRRLEKQASRAQDELEIKEGRVSAHVVQRRNDMFSAFDPARASIRIKNQKA